MYCTVVVLRLQAKIFQSCQMNDLFGETWPSQINDWLSTLSTVTQTVVSDHKDEEGGKRKLASHKEHSNFYIPQLKWVRIQTFSNTVYYSCYVELLSGMVKVADASSSMRLDDWINVSKTWQPPQT